MPMAVFVARRAAPPLFWRRLADELRPAVRTEICWAFMSPRTWLGGVAANLLLAACWLLVQPLNPHSRHDGCSTSPTRWTASAIACCGNNCLP